MFAHKINNTSNNSLYNDSGVVDLFCGIGGLTQGFVLEKFNTIAGIDIDSSCRYGYEYNNKTPFFEKDINILTKEDLLYLFKDTKIKILVGCAPCQPFSSYNFKNNQTDKWFLLNKFAKLIEDIQPEIVSMENVPQLLNFKKASVFEDFVEVLKQNNYHISYKIVFCPDYGVPQKRKRLVLLASKYSQIQLIPTTHQKHITVRETIGNLEFLEHGQTSTKDPLHKAALLKDINLQRIKQSKQGGSWKDWDENLVLECHKKLTGKTYVSVYGRMSWDEPSPTITTQCNGIGNGRFGHPEQDRAISLREAALLQTFPKEYQFFPPNKPYSTKVITTHIGNAVPVILGQVIAKSIKQHLNEVFNYGKE